MVRVLCVLAAIAVITLWAVFGSPLGSGTATESDTCNKQLCLIEIVRVCESKNPKTAALSFAARLAEGQTAPVTYRVEVNHADKMPFMSSGTPVTTATRVIQPGEVQQESIPTNEKTGLEITISTLSPDDEVGSFTISTDPC